MARLLRSMPPGCKLLIASLFLIPPVQAQSIRCPEHMAGFNDALRVLEEAVAESNKLCDPKKLQSSISLLGDERGYLLDCAGSRDMVIRLARTADQIDREARILMDQCSRTGIGSP